MRRKSGRKGMTLIELILVMALLTIIMAISMPTLSTFFKGRALAEESRRFIALARYARSEAVSRSTLLELWIEPKSGEYGLQTWVEYEDGDWQPVDFTLDDRLAFDIDPKELDAEGRARILFMPDGSIDEESIEAFRIQEGELKIMEIGQAEFGMGYVIRDAYDEGYVD